MATKSVRTKQQILSMLLALMDGKSYVSGVLEMYVLA